MQKPRSQNRMISPGFLASELTPAAFPEGLIQKPESHGQSLLSWFPGFLLKPVWLSFVLARGPPSSVRVPA